ncbi:MAG: hypothetical protein LBR66_01555 [Candidatus Symbiothrix sp.]|nr:hypothetical protein [Candidatus Symbiothrix sp.]
MKNKFNMKQWVSCLIITAACGLVSCDSMLKTEFDQSLEVTPPKDTLYTTLGIFSKLQRVVDAYVLTGELRGDLLNCTSEADKTLQAINNFNWGTQQEIDANPYLGASVYYDVVNSCNFFLTYADTLKNKQMFLKEWASVTAIRAWCYMQLILNFGQATYYTQPILSTQDQDAILKDPSASITDLESLLAKEEGNLRYAARLQNNSGYPMDDHYFIKAQLLLADLNLWTGNYVPAMELYKDYIDTHPSYASLTSRYLRWDNSEFQSSSASSNNGDVQTFVIVSNLEEVIAKLPMMSYPSSLQSGCTWMLTPSEGAIDMFARQSYNYKDADENTGLPKYIYTTGDMRGINTASNGVTLFSVGEVTYSYAKYKSTEAIDSIPIILKYGIPNLTGAYLYRLPTIFMHYAEALNHAGYPSAAFSILKYGILNPSQIDSTYTVMIGSTPTPTSMISAWEIYHDVEVQIDDTTTEIQYQKNIPYFFTFSETLYSSDDTRIGVHGRGCGASEADTTYIIPEELRSIENKDAAIRYVDEMILQELGLETAFEGNRFQDLMRFANYYGEDFLADRVARKQNYPNRDEALYQKLLNRNNWYLPLNRK